MLNVTSRAVYAIAPLLLLGTTLIGCSNASKPSTSASESAVTSPAATTAPSESSSPSWETVLPGEAANDLTFKEDGSLQHGDKALLDSIPVTYVSDGSAIYAKRLLVSNSSPSGNYNIVKGCEEAEPNSGLCWAVFLVDKAEGTAYPVTVGKYGGQDWVQWSSDDRYAVLVEMMEGSSWIYVVDLDTETSKNLGEMSANVDLNSFQWTGDRTFTINVDGAPMEVDINTVFEAS